jgi:hypothetical protein
MFEDDEHGAGNRLAHNFTLYFHFPQDSDWSINSYKEISTFSTVEKMVQLMDAIEPIVEKGMLFIMRDEIKPMWEDPINKQGGSFCYRVSKSDVYKSFKMLTFAYCGGTSLSNDATFIDNVTGITVSPKQGDHSIVKIWTANMETQDPTCVKKFYESFSAKGCIFKKHTN